MNRLALANESHMSELSEVQPLLTSSVWSKATNPAQRYGSDSATTKDSTRSAQIAVYFAAGAALGAVAGYGVYSLKGSPRCSPDFTDRNPCGPIQYMIIGGGIGMPVGALVGYLRTRP
jgi:hypothetical protein